MVADTDEESPERRTLKNRSVIRDVVRKTGLESGEGSGGRRETCSGVAESAFDFGLGEAFDLHAVELLDDAIEFFVQVVDEGLGLFGRDRPLA